MDPKISSSPSCFRCGTVLGLKAGNVGRSETCPQCITDVRVCKNCKHYDPGTYNECREPQAERVVEKDRRNFCDYFHLVGGSGEAPAVDPKAEALKKLDDLFKK